MRIKMLTCYTCDYQKTVMHICVHDDTKTDSPNMKKIKKLK